MKKTLRFSLIALLVMLCNVATAQEVVFDFTTNGWGLPENAGNKGTTAADFSNGTYTITLEAGSGYYYNTYDDYLMLGKKGATLTFPAFDFAVSKIVVTGREGASAKTTHNIFVGETAVSTQTTSSKVAHTYEIAEDYQAAGNIYVYQVTNANNDQIVKIEIYKAGGVVKADPAMSYNPSSYTVALGEAFTAPALTIDDEELPITYASSNEEVATVDAATGEVTILSRGYATITATFAGDEAYLADEASYTINVTATEVTLPYSEPFKEGIGSFNETMGAETDEALTYVWSHDKSNGCMKATAYKGGTKASESKLVSPLIDLTAATNPLLSFDHCINRYFTNAADETSLLVQVEGETEWTELEITYPATPTSTWSAWESTSVNLAAYAGKKIYIAFQYTSTTSSAGTWEIKNVYIENVEKNLAGIEYPESNVTADLNTEFTAPVLANPNNLTDIVYASSNEAVATVDAEGNVTLVGRGYTVISATFAGNDLFFEGSADYKLCVTATEVALPYSEPFIEGIGSFTTVNKSTEEGAWENVWYLSSYNGQYFMKASAYSGSAKASDNWLVSPIIDLTGATYAKLSYTHCYLYLGSAEAADAVLSVLYKIDGEETWNELPATFPAANTVWYTDVLTLDELVGKKIQIAFQYTSTTEAAGTWEIYNVLVEETEEPTVGINGVEVAEDAKEQVIYNLAGQRLAQPIKGINIINGKKVFVK